MAGVRKLQGEVDRTLKAIGEHLSEFDVIWEKVAVAPTANLKEKYEADLKKEIKKLQRLRDAAKVFIAHHDIKNKKPLLDIRKVIEGKMEQFKVLEKETKTKAYSKEGLSQAVRGARGSGGEDEERREVCKAWIDEFSALLHGQMEEMEGRLEQVKADRGGKKAKSKVGPGESLEELLRSIDRHQFHLSQLADVKEKLDDESLAPEQVEGVKDSVEYYVTNNQEPDFQEDESIYDELDLGSSKEEGGEGGEDEGEGGVGGKVEEEEGAVGEEKEGEGKGAGVEEEEEEAEGKRSTSPTKAKPTPAPPSAPPRPAPIATNTKTTGVINTSKPAPTALPSPASSTSTSAKPIPTPTPTLITPITRITPTSAAAKPPLTVTPLAGAVVNGAKKPAPAVPSPMGMGGKGVESMASIVGRGGKPEERRTTTVTPLTPITSLSPPSSLTTTPKPILPSPVPSPTLPKPATAATPTVAKVEVAQSRPLLISPVMKISTAAPSPAPPSSTFSTSISSAPSTPSFTSTPSSPTRSTSSTASTSTVPISALPHAPPSRPSSSASLTPADESAYTSPTSLNPPPTSSSSFALGISAPPPSLLTASPPSSSSTSQPPLPSTPPSPSPPPPPPPPPPRPPPPPPSLPPCPPPPPPPPCPKRGSAG